MKKISLITLAVVAMSTSAFANSDNYSVGAYDTNYITSKGMMSSETSYATVSGDAEASQVWETLGYGLSDNMDVKVGFGYFIDDGAEEAGFGNVSLGTTYRASKGSVNVDVLAELTLDTASDSTVNSSNYNELDLGLRVGQTGTFSWDAAVVAMYDEESSDETVDSKTDIAVESTLVYNFDSKIGAGVKLSYVMDGSDAEDDETGYGVGVNYNMSKSSLISLSYSSLSTSETEAEYDVVDLTARFEF